MMTILRWILIAYITYIAALYLLQRDFLYYPVGETAIDGEQTYELTRGDSTLRGWVINPGMARAILYYGGNAERVSRSIGVSKTMFSEYSVYLVQYRGYGGSDGEPTEADLYADALAIYDDISPRHDAIAVIGRSLGTGIATWVASQRDVSHTVLITPFDSIENVASDRYIGVPVHLLLKDKYESWRRAGELTSDVLVFIAENDHVIPRRYTDNLLRYLDKDRLTTHVLAGTGHQDISLHPQYYPLMQRFLSK